MIGHGGMGRVWQARDTRLARLVAIKELMLPPMRPAQWELRLKQAAREGKNAAALADHPNIVTVYDVVLEDGSPWIVMQLVKGRSLRAVLQDPDGNNSVDQADPRLTPLSEERVAHIAEAMLSALGALHEVGIVHRDLKPHNIMLSDDGRILLTDFGIAKSQSDTTMTVPGSFMGTMAYIAPERAEGEPGSPASDYFSLGVTLFEAVEGYSPFERKDSWTGTLTAILTKPLPPMRNAKALAPLIQALTHKSPHERPTKQQALALLTDNAVTRSSSATPKNTKAEHSEAVTEVAAPQMLPSEAPPQAPAAPAPAPAETTQTSLSPADRPKSPPWQASTTPDTDESPPPLANAEPADQTPSAKRRLRRSIAAAVAVVVSLVALMISAMLPTKHRAAVNQSPSKSSPSVTPVEASVGTLNLTSSTPAAAPPSTERPLWQGVIGVTYKGTNFDHNPPDQTVWPSGRPPWPDPASPPTNHIGEVTMYYYGSDKGTLVIDSGAGTTMNWWTAEDIPTRDACRDQVLRDPRSQLQVNGEAHVCMITAADRVVFAVVPDRPDSQGTFWVTARVWS
ncbi:MAG: serine/threonine protein kinase [Catenulispora sp.]|nr:serine/threonine protein kinase [Catenulispora sp.]